MFIVDAYANEDLFDLYVDCVPATVPVKILTKHQDNKFVKIAKMVADKRPIDVRTSPDVHDRFIFVDGRAWILGASIKDAARKKPTVLVPMDGVRRLRDLVESAFQSGAALI